MEGLYSGAHRVTTSSLTMEVDAVTHAIQHDTQITHSLILTDLMNFLQKVESGMGCPDWHSAIHILWLQRLLWIYCPGHARVSGMNRQIDWQVQQISHLVCSLAGQKLRSLNNFLNMDRPQHHSIDRLTERGVEKERGQNSTLQGQK